MSQSLSQLYTHIVFHVNLVNKVYITEGLQEHLHAYLAGICKKQDSSSIIIGGTEDHIHILCRMSKNIAPSAFLEELKANSSKWIKTQSNEYGAILKKFSWQKGYGVFSVSSSQLEKVKKYIANQKEHHRKINFTDEYIALLEKHGVEYDKKYLWS